MQKSCIYFQWNITFNCQPVTFYYYSSISHLQILIRFLYKSNVFVIEVIFHTKWHSICNTYRCNVISWSYCNICTVSFSLYFINIHPTELDTKILLGPFSICATYKTILFSINIARNVDILWINAIIKWKICSYL